MSEWIEIADVGEFSHTDRKLVDLGGQHQIGLFKLPDGFYAVSAWCSHQKATIIHGDIEGYEIECPLHAARFDLRNGQHKCLPAVRPIKAYETRVEAGKVLLKKPE
ncbi:MAG TPA: non-heme iron oxygenase ferredoxin subunit [Kiritimatiellia bacterium]|nr:non-heme iron oxygenase ferredoxin subunit [Kiritimatiellia bacterium]HMO99149.1 non-heme iron oxygenase ferredoxin subunit [Kiritimatiellia bacterium]HMP95673.1 non-heme iron oxygenase ferredoxin subunit [Kiritimatiellia bacterium]